MLARYGVQLTVKARMLEFRRCALNVQVDRVRRALAWIKVGGGRDAASTWVELESIGIRIWSESVCSYHVSRLRSHTAN